MKNILCAFKGALQDVTKKSHTLHLEFHKHTSSTVINSLNEKIKHFIGIIYLEQNLEEIFLHIQRQYSTFPVLPLIFFYWNNFKNYVV